MRALNESWFGSNNLYTDIHGCSNYWNSFNDHAIDDYSHWTKLTRPNDSSSKDFQIKGALLKSSCNYGCSLSFGLLSVSDCLTQNFQIRSAQKSVITNSYGIANLCLSNKPKERSRLMFGEASSLFRAVVAINIREILILKIFVESSKLLINNRISKVWNC